MKLDGYNVCIQGNALVNFFNAITKNNITISHITREEAGSMCCFVPRQSFSKVVSITKHLNLDMRVLNKSGLIKVLDFFRARLGLVIGAVLSLIFFIIINQFTFDYKILGAKNISPTQIESSIASFGVKKYAINSFNTRELEQHLSQEINQISMVSVIKKGTTLIINIKEKISQIEDDFEPILANYNMLITDLEVFAGYTHLKVGDSVLKGDIIVQPFMLTGDGTTTNCKPIANIKGTTWFTNSTTFYSIENTKTRTGKKLTNSFYSIGKATFLKKDTAVAFENYEKESKVVMVNSWLIPIYFHTTTYYECETKEVVRDFEKEKDAIINELFTQTKKQIPVNILWDDEKVVISNYQDKFIISVYIQAEVTIKGE